MRLDKNDTNIILSTVESIFGNVKVYLFEKKIKVISKLEGVLHKPIDIVLHKNFEREIILKRSLLLEK